MCFQFLYLEKLAEFQLYIGFSKLFEIFLKKGLQFQNGCGIITEPSDETANRIVGVDYNEGPPVPIPNTEVKLVCAENTRLATARDDRLAPTLKADIQ